MHNKICGFVIKQVRKENSFKTLLLLQRCVVEEEAAVYLCDFLDKKLSVPYNPVTEDSSATKIIKTLSAHFILFVENFTNHLFNAAQL